MACALCEEVGGEVIWQDDFCRVLDVDDPDYPGFCRVVLNRHAQEMTDLDASERSRLMAVVWAVEGALREVLRPAKVNLASLGNVVPHLHWHVIPRFADDRHFPNPVWGTALRDGARREVDRVALRRAIARRLG
jgi:diadenosine tetraphosphate (Ap4A) HIT family hydrolase